MSTRRFVKGGATGVEEDAESATLDPRLAALAEEFGEQSPPVAIVVAGDPERERVLPTEEELTKRGISFQTHEMPEHMNAALVVKFAETAGLRGVRVIIATAGRCAQLPGVLAAHTDLPVIAVPLGGGALGGFDTLLATAAMTDGVPVAVMSINGVRNAAIYASHILNAMPLAPSDGE